MAALRASAPIDEASLYAEYPFLPGADALLGDAVVSVRQLLVDPAYDRARAIGRARIRSAIDDPRGGANVADLAGAGGDVRLLSFLFARLILSAAPNDAPRRRWAVAEAKRSYARLSEAASDELEDVAHRLGYGFRPIGREIAVDLVDYLALAVPIREADFRLARQDVTHGQVVVDPARAARLLEEGVRIRLAVRSDVNPEVVALIREREAELLAEVAQRTPLPVARPGVPGGVIRPDRFPPCIRKMQRALAAGENLSHAGRFALAAFLYRVGADFETIVDAYRNAPDFEESITRYQVEHITHHDDGAGYRVPECDTLRSHGLCVREGDPEAPNPIDRARDERCFDPALRHPLQYYRNRGGVEVERGSASSEAAPHRPGAPERSRSTGPR